MLRLAFALGLVALVTATPAPAEIARIIKDARRMRAEAEVELFRSAGRGIARLSHALVTLVATPRSAHGGMKNV